MLGQWTFKIPLIFLIVCAYGIRCSNLTSNVTEDEEDAGKKLETLLNNLKKVTSQAVKAALPLILDQASSQNISVSPQCQRSLFKFLAALTQLKPWAVYMVDAWAKSFDGILLGTISAFGNYDECIAVEATESKRKNGPVKKLFDGQYCTLEMSPHLPPKPRFWSVNRRIEAFNMYENNTELLGDLTRHIQLFYLLPFRLGICVPSTCSAEDVYFITKTISNRLMDSKIAMPRCEVRNKFTIESYQIAPLCIFGCLFVVVVTATMLDIVFRIQRKTKKDKKPSTNLGRNVLQCFSAYTNLEKLLNVDTGEEELKVLHGIKFYSMCWIVLGHTYYHINFNMLRNLKLTLSLFQDFAFNAITNATLVVDNFFFISGLLTSFMTFRMVQKTGLNFKFWQFILHRIYRFLPMMMTFLGITMFLPWFGDGPLWHENIDPMVEACRKDWWTNLIFINNFYRSGDVGCISHSWYLAADMQIYLICLLVLVPLVKYPKVALSLNLSLILASITVSGWYNYAKDLPPTMLYSKPDKEQTSQLMSDVYYTPYHHLGPYCMGIFIGYLLHTDWVKRKISPLVQTLAWITTLVLTASTIFGVHSWNTGEDPGRLAAAIYAALSRIGWTLGLAWIIWACITGHGGIMNKLLSWKALIPLSRLTFSVYVVHPYVQKVFYSNIRGVIEARNYMAVFIWFGFLIVSFMLGLVVSMFIESPFLNLGTIIFEQHRQWKGERTDKANSQRNNSSSRQSLGSNKTLSDNDIYQANDLKKKSEPSTANGCANDGFVCHL